MSKGTKQVRVSDATIKLVRMFAGELQLQSGQSISDDRAIYELFKRYRKDLIGKLGDLRELNGNGADE